MSNERPDSDNAAATQNLTLHDKLDEVLAMQRRIDYLLELLSKQRGNERQDTV